jgi:hypothetical protein
MTVRLSAPRTQPPLTPKKIPRSQTKWFLTDVEKEHVSPDCSDAAKVPYQTWYICFSFMKFDKLRHQ